MKFVVMANYAINRLLNFRGTYNTKCFSEEELISICKDLKKADIDAITEDTAENECNEYYIVDDKELKDASLSQVIWHKEKIA